VRYSLGLAPPLEQLRELLILLDFPYPAKQFPFLLMLVAEIDDYRQQREKSLKEIIAKTYLAGL
jgi:hypothetical protein